MITYTQKKQFLTFAKKLSRSNLPSWNELPEVDLYMDQVLIYIESHITEFVSKDSKLLTKSMINNYVKQGIMPAPVNKKYSKENLAYIIMICILKQILPLPKVKQIIDRKMAKSSIENCYNSFCILYKKAISSIIKYAKDAYRDVAFTELEDFNFFLTLGANTAKILIEKLLDEE